MKNTLRISCLVFIVAILTLSLMACEKGSVKETPETTAAPCEHVYEESIQAPAMALKDGVKLFACGSCGDSYTEAIPMTKTVKILAVGNSFSSDAVELLWNICKDGGAETVIIGNLYIGGCSLDTHYSNLVNNAAEYKYYKNTDGSWTNTPNYRIMKALEDEEWDIITVQQSSGVSGVPSSFSKLQEILDIIADKCPSAQLYWHMTWAYQQNSTHNSFPTYNKDQITMYNKIVNTVKSTVLTKKQICGVIPAGTAIQNLRTSFLGDTLTRDGYHLSYTHGRYTAALTWYAYLTGGDVEVIDWIPEDYAVKYRGTLSAMKESVINAIENPFEVTQSSITVKPKS